MIGVRSKGPVVKWHRVHAHFTKTSQGPWVKSDVQVSLTLPVG